MKRAWCQVRLMLWCLAWAFFTLLGVPLFILGTALMFFAEYIDDMKISPAKRRLAKRPAPTQEGAA